MKLILLTFLFTCSIYANKDLPADNRGVVIVLEAPLFRFPDEKSKVLKYVRKGDVIYIHPKYFRRSPINKDFDRLDDYFTDQDPVKLYFEPSLTAKDRPADLEQDELAKKPEDDKAEHFYMTLDDLGSRAYIPKKFVKLIYQDEREFLSSVSPYTKDPTDYRLPEPLSPTYPFYNKDQYRYWLALGTGSQAKKKYPYQENTEKETFGSQLELNTALAWKVHEQNEQRMFFGAHFHVHYFENNFEIFFPVFNRRSKERRLTYGIGPYVSYDTIRFSPFQITLYQSFLLNFHQHNVFQTLTSSDGEERAFRGVSLTSSSGALLTYKNLLGKFIDLFVGTSIQVELPYKLQADAGNSSFAGLWQMAQNDRITYSTQANLSIFAGIQLVP